MRRSLVLFALLFVLASPAFANVVLTYSFVYQVGGAIPLPAQYSLLSNAPDQVFTLHAEPAGSVYSWLWPSLSSVTAPALLTIGVNPVALPPGTYQGAFDVLGAPYGLTFVVNLTVYPQPGGIFNVSPASLYFAVDAGTGVSNPQALFTFSTWVPISYAVSSSSAWLSVSAGAPSQYVPGAWMGNTPDQVSVYVNAGSLQPGTYYGFVQFIAGSATNSPFTVPVTLLVRPAPPTAMVVVPERLSFAAVTGKTAPGQSLQVTLSNYNYFSPYTTSVSSSDSWLIPELQAANAPFMLRVNVNTTSLRPGAYSGRITITGPSWSGLARVVPVDLVITSDSQPAITSVKDAVSSFPFVSPGSWLSITGRNLASATYRLAAPLPTSLDGISVQIGGSPAPLSYVSPEQINVYVPTNLAGSTGTMNVTLLTPHGAAFSTIDLHSLAPALFLSVDNHAAAAHIDGSTCGHDRPAKPGAIISLYGAGFGEWNDSAPFPRSLAAEVQVWIGGRAAHVHYAGIISIGLYQFNVEVPSDLPAGEHPIAVELVGAHSTYTQGGVVVPVQN